ncbi:MAG TPA: hypothetical protein VFG06_09625 [Thermodesulfovibrionales bacterium]|nr:hypothetical protein [Thermodesulfovibrionales bacterium]
MKESGKKHLYVIGVLVVLVFIMYLWKNVAVKNVRERMEAQQIQLIEKSQ